MVDNRIHRRQSDDGQALAELVIVMPVLLLVALLMIFFGRLESAQGDVQAAARAGAEAAVVQGNTALADSSAATAVTDTLGSDGVVCPSPVVTTVATPIVVGKPGTITVSVTCTANLSDVAAPGIPGAKTFTASSTAPIDPYAATTSGFTIPDGSIDPHLRTTASS